MSWEAGTACDQTHRHSQSIIAIDSAKAEPWDVRPMGCGIEALLLQIVGDRGHSTVQYSSISTY